MAEVQSYLVVDEDSKRILDGPFAWDGESSWQHPPGLLLLEADALARGYVWPPMPGMTPDENP